MAKLSVGKTVEGLGEYLREQRRQARLSLRQLSELAGVSNPYLSQIERGLRRPSAEVLQQLAKALRVSAETLYVRAGILDAEDHNTGCVELAVVADPALSERQKQVLLEIYGSFRRSRQAAGEGFTPGVPEDGVSGATEDLAEDVSAEDVPADLPEVVPTVDVEPVVAPVVVEPDEAAVPGDERPSGMPRSQAE
ncbi:MAG: helix-turn-helix domain-containing protein [Actinomycetota bacterium]|nr:helix-turn-helix domain-containing protein [Actinomycetota bacterium]